MREEPAGGYRTVFANPVDRDAEAMQDGSDLGAVAGVSGNATAARAVPVATTFSAVSTASPTWTLTWAVVNGWP